MRTTLTLDEDVATKLKALARRSDQSFKEIVNETLRCGLLSLQKRQPSPPFQVMTRDLGNVRPGVSLDSISDLLDQVESPQHR